MNQIIPRCMSTQHPDNANPPYFSAGPVLTAEEEVKEAYFAFKRLGCDEQMWDHEGKEVDSFVVPKLLSAHSKYFRKQKLGKNVFLTLRVPNPSREKGTAKGLLEILESIPRSYDIAKKFYRQGIAPIFEIILPMTTSALEIKRVWNYYRKFVIEKERQSVLPGDISLKEWIGEFAPKDIHIIPLIEDRKSLLNADKIVEGFLAGEDVPYQRVFLARSDPAMSYGSLSAVLLLKIALVRLHQLEKRRGIPIYPILGLGSAPFRGNFKPTNAKTRLVGYPSAQTFTVQSAFKFDYPEELVRHAIRHIKQQKRKAPTPVTDEKELIRLVDIMTQTFQGQVERLGSHISEVAHYVPARRQRRLHVGLFGYARKVAGQNLPRAIGFCASLYSMGIPPELLGLSNLKPQDFKTIKRHYPNFIDDMREVLSYFDPESLKYIPPSVATDIKKTVRLLKLDHDPEMIHQSLVRAIREGMEKKNKKQVTDLIAHAARERKFLG